MKLPPRFLGLMWLVLALGLVACSAEAESTPVNTGESASPARTAPLDINADYVNDSPALVGATGRPQLLEFYTTWCSTCRQMKPTVHALEAEYWGKVDFLYFDRELPVHAELVARFGVRGQPIFILLSPSGEVIAQWFGTTSAEDMRSKLDRVQS
jgi:thioredoxin-like negative regulator of GroEL